MLNLAEEERQLVKDHLDRGEPLPDEYRFRLFKNPLKAELIWPGKTQEVCTAELPFQIIEHIDAPRLNNNHYMPPNPGWTNKLIWGDNKLILSSLRSGPLRQKIEEAGGIKLIYIDPPFDVGADFTMPIEVGNNESFSKEPSVVEEIVYRDTWGKGVDSYLAMIYERLLLMRDLMAEDASIFVHCDWRLNSCLRRIMDDIFSQENFLNEIIWHYYNKMQGNINRFASNHDTILFFKKGKHIYHTLKELRESPKKQQKRVWDKETKSLKQAKDESGNLIYYEDTERTLDDVWKIPYLMPADRKEKLGYPTQKPECLLERIIRASSNPGDLVADFFCGSGTTMSVAEKLGRKWIGCDLSRFAVHTSRKRLIQVQCELKSEEKPYSPFEILNLGHYDRQYYIGIDNTLSKQEQEQQARIKENDFYNLIHRAYKSEPLHQMLPFHGMKQGAAVYIGPLDAPITMSEIESVLKAAQKHKFKSVDVLGFEFEMSLKTLLQDQAKAKGVELALRYIPRDVFDKRAIDKGQVVFYDVAYLEATSHVINKAVSIKLSDFGVFYRQEDTDAIINALRPGKSKIIVDNGDVVKLIKDRQGKIERQVLTKHWSDWIDYWAIDFDYESLQDPEMGNCVFENQWQTFRTKKNRKLELESASYTYSKPGTYNVAIKVVDIFGHDTTKVIEVGVC